MDRPMVLLIDNKHTRSQEIATTLEKHFETISAKSFDETLDLYEMMGFKLKVILLNAETYYSFKTCLFESLKEKNSFAEIIVYSENKNFSDVVTIMKKGANNYISGPLYIEALKHSVINIYETMDIIKQIDTYIRVLFINKFLSKERMIYLQEILHQKKLIHKSFNHKDLFNIIDQDLEDNITNNETLQKKFGLENEISKTTKKDILIIDDESSWRKLLTSFLSDEYNVSSVKTGQAALNQLQKNSNFSIVLLDIFLPDIRGDLLISKIKNIQPDVEIIVISAYQDVDIAVHMLKTGVIDYLTKPFSKTDLKLRINQAVYKQYLNQFIPDLLQDFIQKRISYRNKMTILSDLLEQKKKFKLTMKMKDIYLFFPELKQLNINENQSLKKNIDKDAFLAFIECLQEKLPAE
jgi:PleD family two-component response regulator